MIRRTFVSMALENTAAALSGALGGALIGCHGDPIAPCVPRDDLTYLALGNSITKRGGQVTYANLLATSLMGLGVRQTVNNALPGFTTRLTLDSWADRIAGGERADLVTVMLGVSDVYTEPGASGPRLSEAQFAANQQEIAERVLAFPSRPTLVFLTATWYDGFAGADMGALAAYNARTVEVAARYGCPVVDCFTPSRQLAARYGNKGWTDGAPDGDAIHPSNASHAVLHDGTVFPALRSILTHAPCRCCLVP